MPLNPTQSHINFEDLIKLIIKLKGTTILNNRLLIFAIDLRCVSKSAVQSLVNQTFLTNFWIPQQTQVNR